MLDLNNPVVEFGIIMNQIQEEGSIKDPLVLDIAIRIVSPNGAWEFGYMHTGCSELLPDEGWEYLGRMIVRKDLWPKSLRKCGWCGYTLLRKSNVLGGF